MDISHFLAMVLGLYFIVKGLFFAARRDFLKAAVADYFDSPGQVMIGGSVALIIGTLLIVSHSVWELNWKGLITLFGYLAFLKGIIHWFFPQVPSSWAMKIFEGRAYGYIAGIIFLLGVLFCYIGFFL